MLTLQVIACIGIITGAFLLFQIRLNDFTGNIFHRLLDAPKGIREEILEERHCPLLQRHTCEVRTSLLRWRKTSNI